MRKKVYLLFIFALGFMIVSSINSNVYASSNDAESRGYEISNGWNYVGDVNYEKITVNGSQYYSGDMYGWMGAYKYYDPIENEMFVLLLCTGSMQSSQKSYWDQYRWNNQKMEIQFSTSENDVELLSYSPEATEGTITINQTISVNAGVQGDQVVLGYGVSESISYTISEIPVIIKRDSNTLAITHSFINYKKNKSLNSVCCQYISRNNLVLYKIENYNEYKDYQFEIKLECTFYRYGRWNCSSVSDFRTQIFKI